MDENRALHQDIRPIEILILNLMPLKEDTELQLSPFSVKHAASGGRVFYDGGEPSVKNTSLSHLNKFYETFPSVWERRFDGMIITGAPVEQMEFEEVDYWQELTEIMEWTNTHVMSTIYLCWGAQAGLYYHYGLKKRALSEKCSGLFWHKVMNRKIPAGAGGLTICFCAPFPPYGGSHGGYPRL